MDYFDVAYYKISVVYNLNMVTDVYDIYEPRDTQTIC